MSVTEFEPRWGEERLLPLSDLITERYEEKPGVFYQRTPTKLVETIVDEYDAQLFGRLITTSLGGKSNKYAVLDGGTRKEALQRLGITHAPCIVHHGLSLSERASRFLALNVVSKTLRPVDKFHALLAAGDQGAIIVQKVLDEFSIKVGEGTSGVHMLAAINTATKVYNRGGEDHFRRTISVLTNAWPADRKRLTGEMVGGVSMFLHRDKNTTTDEVLIGKLVPLAPHDLLRSASALRSGTGTGAGGGSHAYVARSIAIFVYGAKAKTGWPFTPREEEGHEQRRTTTRTQKGAGRQGRRDRP